MRGIGPSITQGAMVMVFDRLNEWQAPVLREFCGGKTVPEIAATLDMDIQAVRKQARACRTLLNADSIPEICDLAVAAGEIEVNRSRRLLPSKFPIEPPTPKAKRPEHPRWTRYPLE